MNITEWNVVKVTQCNVKVTVLNMKAAKWNVVKVTQSGML